MASLYDLLDPPPEPDIDPSLLARLIAAICDGGKKKPRCTYPICPHVVARAKAIAAWQAIEDWSNGVTVVSVESNTPRPPQQVLLPPPAPEYDSQDDLATAIERSMTQETD